MKINAAVCAGILGIAMTGFMGRNVLAADAPTAAGQGVSKRQKPVVELPLDIKFETGKAEVQTTKANDAEFAKLTRELNNYPYAKIEIEGYADSQGPEPMNQALSEKRAQAVRQRFVEKSGIAPNRITAVGYGEEKPTAKNDTKAGRAENRRVIARIYRLEPDISSPSGRHL